MSDKKQKIGAIVAAALKLAVSALAKLIRSKLLPKAQEKYCKVLQATSEKIIEGAGDIAAAIASEEDTTKKIRRLYLLNLVIQTMDSVAETLRLAGDHLRETVDFTPIINPDENAKIALADIPDAFADNDGCCGPDGCTIA